MPLKTDGIPTDEESVATADRSIDLLFGEVMDLIEDDPDPIGIAYGLFIGLARKLVEEGWTAEELARDVAHHANDQTAEGRA